MQTTPLYPIYSNYQGKVIDFHGWGLPVQFSGIIQEHQTVRQKVGIFDVSHMGEFWVEGPAATEYLDNLVTNEIATLSPGAIRYSPLCYPSGGAVDDLLIYCFTKNKYLVVVNASNIEKDFSWFIEHTSGYQVNVTDVSRETAQLAVQGPSAQSLMKKILPKINWDRDSLKYYHFLPDTQLLNHSVLISRTGYTGEDGFEIYIQPDQAIQLWEFLMDTGKPFGIEPIGLGARDTLRFEAALPLYGNELSNEISPVEAGLARFVKLSKSKFVGKESLQKQYEKGVLRHLVGLEMVDRGVPRSDYSIFANGEKVGFVTSGSYSPTLQKNLAMVLIDSHVKNENITIDIRNKQLAAKLVDLPFYSRTKGVS